MYYRETFYLISGQLLMNFKTFFCVFSKTLEVRHIHDNAIDREKYLYNPINAVTILKRFTGDWKSLKIYAEKFLNTDGKISTRY